MPQIRARSTPALALAAGLLFGGNAVACGEPPTSYTGMVCLFAGNYCPQGYVLADGATSGNPILNSILGSNKLPNLQAQAPAGTRYCILVGGTFPPRP
jgi:microcystin-dependent protein